MNNKKVINTKHERKKGLEPGALIYQGDFSPNETKASCFIIKKNSLETVNDVTSKEKLPKITKDVTLWVRVIGLANIDLIRVLGETYGIEAVTLEDILDTSHAPKFEYFENYFFTILKKIVYEAGNDSVETSQVSTVLFENLIITFEEHPIEELDIVVNRVAKRPDAFHNKGSEYLAYAIIDVIVDDYLGVLDKIQFDIEKLEDEMVSTKGPINTDKLYFIKRLLNSFYRNTRFTDEIVDKLMKSLTFNSKHKISVSYFKDLSDHALKMRDSINSCREIINAVYDENISRTQLQTGYFLNILTIVSVLLWPFMIISGIYGMNFQYIPFLDYRHGFFVSIGIMVAISVLLLLFFKKKKFF